MIKLHTRNTIYLLFLFLIWIIHCAGPLHSSKQLPEISPQHLLEQVHTHASKLETFQGVKYQGVYVYPAIPMSM